MSDTINDNKLPPSHALSKALGILVVLVTLLILTKFGGLFDDTQPSLEKTGGTKIFEQSPFYETSGGVWILDDEATHVLREKKFVSSDAERDRYTVAVVKKGERVRVLKAEQRWKYVGVLKDYQITVKGYIDADHVMGRYEANSGIETLKHQPNYLADAKVGEWALYQIPNGEQEKYTVMAVEPGKIAFRREQIKNGKTIGDETVNLNPSEMPSGVDPILSRETDLFKGRRIQAWMVEDIGLNGVKTRTLSSNEIPCKGILKISRGGEIIMKLLDYGTE